MFTIDIFRHVEDVVVLDAGNVLFREGESGEHAYVVLKGRLDVRVGGRTVDTIESGGLVGELALIDQGPRSATVTAMTDCRLVAIDERRFQFLVQQTPGFALNVMRIMAHRLRSMDARI